MNIFHRVHKPVDKPPSYARKTPVGNYTAGQAVVELVLCVPLLLVMFFTLVDFSCLIFDLQVVANLASQGSSIASRGTSVSAAAAAVLTSSTLNLATNGKVIVSAVYKDSVKGLILTDQSSVGGLSASSKVGSTLNGAATLPGNVVPPATQTVYVTEIFYKYSTITPVGRFISITGVPTQLYDVAYY